MRKYIDYIQFTREQCDTLKLPYLCNRYNVYSRYAKEVFEILERQYPELLKFHFLKFTGEHQGIFLVENSTREEADEIKSGRYGKSDWQNTVDDMKRSKIKFR